VPFVRNRRQTGDIGRPCNHRFATGTLLATSAFAQSAGSLVLPIENEPAPRLFVEPPLPGPLATGVAFIPYQVENLRILPVGGPAARNVSPRVGHLHITVDDLPWQWADYGQSNTIILVNLPRGEHKVLIEGVVPKAASLPHRPRRSNHRANKLVHDS
jgi:hypothetical protein